MRSWRMVVAAMLAAGVVAAPAAAQDVKTEMVELGGERVDSLLLRYDFDAMWAIDAERILLRDTYRDHYLLTLKKPCPTLDMQRSVKFVPALAGRIRSSLTYEVRDKVGQPCDIGRVEQIDNARASALRAELASKS